MSLPKTSLLYGKTIGVIGGGQLGRMMATAARHMGYRLVVLDPTPNCPAAQLADEQIVAQYDDLEAIKQLKEKSDVVTYEFENVDLEAAKYLEAAGVLPQGTKALEITQDREKEKQMLVDYHQPVSPFHIITNKETLDEAVKKIGFPAVVKTCRGGYDGKGQIKINTIADVSDVLPMLTEHQRLIYEAFVAFDCEVSVVFTRSIDGDMCYFPVGENVHRDHVLHTTTVPADVSHVVIEKAKQAAKQIAEAIDVVGTFTLELFVKGNQIFVNELAPRPHNSGHYTIEACNVSQFEQHIRAIVQLPLLPVYFHGASQMINLLGDNLDDFFTNPDLLNDVHIHMYGKDQIKPKRKVGHLTIVAESKQALMKKINKWPHANNTKS